MRIFLLLTSLVITQGGVSVRGRVTGLPQPSAEGLKVALQSRNDRDGKSVEVAALGPDGTFQFPAVSPGFYTLKLSRLPTTFLTVEVAGKDVEVVLRAINPQWSPLSVAGPRVPLQPPPGMAVLSVSQSGNPPGWREGALHYLRVEQSGVLVEEQILEGRPPDFSLTAGNYTLHGYSRACDGNCDFLALPEIRCELSLTLSAGQAVYVERVIQGSACTFRLNPAPVEK